MLDAKFETADQNYRRLRAAFDAGQLSEAQFEEALRAQVIEHEGRSWTIGAASGKWFVSAGDNWVEALPPEAVGAANAGAPELVAAPDPIRKSSAIRWRREGQLVFAGAILYVLARILARVLDFSTLQSTDYPVAISALFGLADLTGKLLVLTGGLMFLLGPRSPFATVLGPPRARMGLYLIVGGVLWFLAGQYFFEWMPWELMRVFPDALFSLLLTGPLRLAGLVVAIAGGILFLVSRRTGDQAWPHAIAFPPRSERSERAGR